MISCRILTHGAAGRTRTGTPVRATDFKSVVSTYSTTAACGWGSWIRTNDAGVKVLCLTAWRYPNIYNYKTHLRQLTYQLVDLQNTHKIGLEPITYCLLNKICCMCLYKEWSRWRDSNPQSSAWKADALAITLHLHMVCHRRFELRTPCLKGRCSACWASGTYWCGITDSNRWQLECKSRTLPAELIPHLLDLCSYNVLCSIIPRLLQI